MSTMGTCKFCGQNMIVSNIQLPEGATYEDFDEDLLQDMYNDAATRDCQCDEGKEWRDKQKASTVSDEALAELTASDYYLKEILVTARNMMLMHPEFKNISLKVVDTVTSMKRAYKLVIDKDGDVIGSRTDTTGSSCIAN